MIAVHPSIWKVMTIPRKERSFKHVRFEGFLTEKEVTKKGV